MNDHWIQITLAILALLAGITIYIRVRSKKNTNKVTQSGNIVGGDQAGRDINRRS